MNEFSRSIDLVSLEDKSLHSPDLFNKILKVKEKIRGKNCIVAFSGGVDSSILLVLAKAFCNEIKVVHFDMPINPSGETRNAIKICELLGIDLMIKETNPLADGDFATNTTSRCYFCKRRNFTTLKNMKARLGFDFVLEGSNVDDLSDHRPGLKALGELEICSPLRDAGFTKHDVRQLARTLNLPNSERPSNTCLSSRIAYGTKITPDLLKAVDQAEILIKNTLSVNNLRARVHESTILRIELEPDDLKNILRQDSTVLLKLAEDLKKIGFKKISLDLEGYKMGSLNYVLQMQ
ncbi:MAG: ATP-dependent sacrificial sulfur transferase LarE [Promethearchaeota archaeon]